MCVSIESPTPSLSLSDTREAIEHFLMALNMQQQADDVPSGVSELMREFGMNQWNLFFLHSEFIMYMWKNSLQLN